jgi:hypothetical protein
VGYSVHGSRQVLKKAGATAITVVLAAVLTGAASTADARATTPIPTFERCVYHSITASHPSGWPCLPFQNRSMLVSWVRQLLAYNGYHTVTFQFLSRRHLRLSAVLDGVPYYGDVVKLGRRKVGLSMNAAVTGSFDSTGDAFTVPFDA